MRQNCRSAEESESERRPENRFPASEPFGARNRKGSPTLRIRRNRAYPSPGDLRAGANRSCGFLCPRSVAAPGVQSIPGRHPRDSYMKEKKPPGSYQLGGRCFHSGRFPAAPGQGPSGRRRRTCPGEPGGGEEPPTSAARIRQKAPGLPPCRPDTVPTRGCPVPQPCKMQDLRQIGKKSFSVQGFRHFISHFHEPVLPSEKPPAAAEVLRSPSERFMQP